MEVQEIMNGLFGNDQRKDSNTSSSPPRNLINRYNLFSNRKKERRESNDEQKDGKIQSQVKSFIKVKKLTSKKYIPNTNKHKMNPQD